jgi:hypothetical protein
LKVRAISRTGSPFVSRRLIASRIWWAVIFGLRPIFTPRALARSRPSPVRARISSRSNSAEKAHLSQAVFARHLNLTVGHVSQLERGAKRPTGAALVLLNVIRRKGLEVIL